MSKLTDENKENIVSDFRSGITQTQLAKQYGVSRRTIGRVIQEKGAPTVNQLSQRDKEILDLVNKYNIEDAAQVDRIFNTPILSLPNILVFLKEATEQELAYLFFEAALAKVQARAQEHQIVSAQEVPIHVKH